jgi:hypothetical protein
MYAYALLISFFCISIIYKIYVVYQRRPSGVADKEGLAGIRTPKVPKAYSWDLWLIEKVEKVL